MTEVYTVGEIATALQISVSTVRNWTENELIEGYLSNMATRKGEFKSASERKYTQDDLYVLNTINNNKTRRTEWQDVADILASGERDKDLPESAMLVMAPTSSEVFLNVARAHEKIEMLETRIKELQTELEAERQKDNRADLLKIIGKLEFMLEMNGINPETGQPKQHDIDPETGQPLPKAKDDS